MCAELYLVPKLRPTFYCLQYGKTGMVFPSCQQIIQKMTHPFRTKFHSMLNQLPTQRSMLGVNDSYLARCV